ncbi:MAG: nucleoside deaminase [Bifidobacteriaceae bacterium]|jgi:tRNA(adenine34) deaminase|nr:nucleoside deaminase [Bifidobacteriaceae bacterium]
MQVKTGFMRVALDLAKVSAAKMLDIPVGACVVFAGKTVSTAVNEAVLRCDPTAHAEILAISAASKKLATYNLRGATLYTTLEPCSMCAGAIINANITDVVFGAYNEKEGAAGSLIDLLRDYQTTFGNISVTGGVLEQECSELLSTFFEKLRNNC